MANRTPDFSFYWSGEKTLGTAYHREKFSSFTMTTVTLLTGLAACPQHRLSWGDSCYRAYKGPKSSNDSLSFAARTKQIWSAWTRLKKISSSFQNVDATRGIWIGLVKEQKLGLFRWTSEEKVGFKNWVIEPDINRSQNCGEMLDYWNYRGKWNDKRCPTTLPFICVKKG